MKYLVCTSALLVLTACGGGGSNSTAPDSTPPPQVSNNAPTVQGITTRLIEGQNTEIQLLGTDSDGNIVEYQVSTLPQNGVLAGTPPQLTYTPNDGFAGTDTFEYRATDNDGAISEPATVNITVDEAPQNNAPVGVAQTLTLLEDNTIPIALSGTDADGTIASYQVVSAFSNGTVTGDIPNLTYTPNQNFFGTDVMDFTVTDDDDLVSSVVSITINVQPVNDTPTISGELRYSVPENILSTGVSLSGLAEDVEDENLEYELLPNNDSELFTLSENTELLFREAPDFETPFNNNENNSYRVSFAAIDSLGAQVEGQIHIEVLDASSIEFVVTYPTAGANLGGNKTSTAISGYFIDIEDGSVLNTDLAQLHIDGTPIQVDGIEWSTNVNVSQGLNTLTLEAVQGEDVVHQEELQFDNTVLPLSLEAPYGGVHHLEQQLIYVADGVHNAIFAVSTINGDIRELSGPTVGTGVNFKSPQSLTLDKENTTLYVADSGLDAIVKVDMESGDRSVFVESRIDNAALSLRPKDITYVPASKLLYLANGSTGVLETVHTETLERTLIYQGDRNDVLGNVDAIAVDYLRDALYVVNGRRDTLYKIDLMTNELTLILDGTEDGANYSQLRNLRMSTLQNSLYIAGSANDANRQPILYRLNFNTNELSVVHSNDTITNTSLGALADVVILDTGFMIWMLDSINETILTSISGSQELENLISNDDATMLHDPNFVHFNAADNQWLVTDKTAIYTAQIVNNNSELNILSDSANGSGPALINVVASTYDKNSGRLFVLDNVSFSRQAIYEINTTNGNRTLVFDTESAGTNIFTFDLVFDAAQERLYYADYRFDTIFAYPLTSAAPIVIANDEIGTGQPLRFITAAAGDLESNRLFIYDRAQDNVLALDLATGNRTLVSTSETQTGDKIDLSGLSSMTFDSENERLLAITRDTNLLVEIDVATGVRSPISMPDATLTFFGSNSITYDKNKQLAYVNDYAKKAIYVIDLISGERAIMGR